MYGDRQHLTIAPRVRVSDSERPTRTATAHSGWLIGVLVGVLACVVGLPRVRYTTLAQLEFALAQQSVPWMHALDARRSAAEAPALDRIAAAAPGDYLIQVGRATALVTAGAPPAHSRAERVPDSAIGDTTDRTLMRLYLLARHDPATPGAYAHLARYMMADRVRIQRPEARSWPASAARPPAPPSTARSAEADPTLQAVPAASTDVQLMQWALSHGEARDPKNAFWPAMLATTDFAALRDSDALAALDRAAHKSQWDAYIYEEVLGQWRMYSAAYGDNGAAQKVGPLSLVAFPHLREIRSMAEVARWYADRAEERGHNADALRIRRAIVSLGVTMRSRAQWAYEALYGTDLLLIASVDSDTVLRNGAVRSESEWEHMSGNYLRLLRSNPIPGELPWLRRQVAESCALRTRIDSARTGAAFPGVPPGIPLAPLFGDWMAGIYLVQEMLALMAAALALWLWQRSSALRERAPHLRSVMLAVLVATAGGSAVLLMLGVPSPRVAALFLSAAAVLILIMLDAVARRRAGAAGIRAGWNAQCTAVAIGLIVVPAFAALLWLRPELSGLHPVAGILTTLMGGTKSPTAGDAVSIALLSITIPLAIAILAAIRAWLVRTSPLGDASLAIRKSALPGVACLLVVYLLLMNQMLRLDTLASSELTQAARNDRQWVLTHTGEATG